MTENPIILFCFAGRQSYLELQLPYIIKLLEQYPNIEYHLWNFSRNENDHLYLQTLKEKHDRIILFNEFYEGENRNLICQKRVGVICNCTKCRVGKWTEPYKYYSNPLFADVLFVKMDDDIIFIDTNRFTIFIQSILENCGDNSNIIMTANVINNGVCAFYDSEIKKNTIENRIIHPSASINDFWYLCTNKSFFQMSHNFFLQNREMILSAPITTPITKMAVSKTRFSINTIGFTYNTVKKIAQLLGKEIGMNDEGIISHHFSFMIVAQFITVHFHFSDQRVQLTTEEENHYLHQYKQII